MGELILNENIYNSILETIKDASNVCILIDYDNLFHTMKRYAIDVTDDEYDICRFFNETYGKNRIRSFRAYADFEQVKVSLRKLQEQRVQIRNVYGNNRTDKYRKNASDIELSIDAIEMTHREKDIDTYVIVTSDSDMIPIMSRLKYKNKSVHLYYASQNTAQTVQFGYYCDFSCDLLELFNVDIQKSNPEFWFDQVKTMVKQWYEDGSNSGKTYGFTWIKNDIVSKLHLSELFAGEIINKMVDNGSLIKKDNGKRFEIPTEDIDI